MHTFIRVILTAGLLAACATPESQAPVPASVKLNNPKLSAKGHVPEGSDQGCLAESANFDAAVTRRTSGDAIVAAFDAVAACRKTAAERLVAEHGQGRIANPEAGATLIGLRGAMRRDVGRLRAAMFNQGAATELRSRIAQAEALQNVLIVNGG